MLNKINNYIFIQILKSCLLVFFIFLSISWLLQITRLLALTNLVQIDIFNVIYLSLFLIPNLITVTIPFIIIFGLLLCFIKLNKDKELISIYSLGMSIFPIKISLIFFALILSIVFIIMNFFISPIIYEKYKIKEFELRNTINFDRMTLSNFIKINNNTTIDFKKNKNSYQDIFINFKDKKNNIIYAKKGNIKNTNDSYIFELIDGFKITFSKGKEIEKLEFNNYLYKIENLNNEKSNNLDLNTFTILDDIQSSNYLNMSYKLIDIVLLLFIIYFFYKNNILVHNFANRNNIYFVLISLIVLIINQVLKNFEIDIHYYFLLIFLSIVSIIFLIKYKELKDE